MSTNNYSIKKILELIKSGGGLVWENPFYLNIVGIRDISNPNKFNDTLIYFWYDENKNLTVREIDGFTTDPGINNLEKPVNYKGCAILKEGWHRKIWVKGKHKGQYDAFVQYAPCKVYRDNDKDKVFDFDQESVEEGVFGINLHRANSGAQSTIVGAWSAGCQVLSSPTDFANLIIVRDKAIKSGQTYFSYMLLLKEQMV